MARRSKPVEVPKEAKAGRRGFDRGETLLRADVARVALRMDNDLLLSSIKKDRANRTEHEEFRDIVTILTTRKFLELRPPENAMSGWETDSVALLGAKVTNLHKEAQAALRFVLITRGGFNDFASGAFREGDDFVPWGIVVARGGLGAEERLRKSVADLDSSGYADHTALLARAFETGRSHVQALQLQNGLNIERTSLARKTGLFRVIEAPNGEQHFVFHAAAILEKAQDRLVQAAPAKKAS